MSEQNGATLQEDAQMGESAPIDSGKGKGKAVAEPQSFGGMEEDEDDSDEETGAEEELEHGNAGDEEEEDMAEIDTSNILDGGRRTRGKNIDFAKAAENAGDELEEDEDDDEDFEAAGEGDGDDAMQE